MANSKFSGICVCGHPWDEHHHSVPLNKEWIEEHRFMIHDGVVGDECQHTNYKGQRINEHEPRCFCANYKDRYWK